jgi:transposase
LHLHKPSGAFDQRVQRVGPGRFGVVAVDCAKRQSKWMLCDFFGRVLLPPTEMKHDATGFRAALDSLKSAVREFNLGDVLVAVERTGNYHRPPLRAFRDAGYDTRVVHPFASSQFRQVEHPGDKTDDHDLGGIHRAAVVGFGLVETPLEDPFLSLRLLVRHRRDLVQKNAAVQCQIREHLEATLPGFAALFDDDKFWNASLAMPLARRLDSPDAMRRLGADGIMRLLDDAGVRYQRRTIDKVLAWAEHAAPAEPDATLQLRIVAELDDDRLSKKRLISSLEIDIAALLAQTPYLLLVAIPGLNVVSAAEFAAEAGPISLYANPSCITGRAGLFPSRYQSDSVDVRGAMVRCANRRLRAALLMIADNLLLVNHYFRGLAALWKQRGTDPRLAHVRVAKRFSRLAFAIVAGRQIVPHPCCREPHTILDKLIAFHLEHRATPEQIRTTLAAAAEQLPPAARERERHALENRKTKFRRARRPQVQKIGDILTEVLAKLLATTVQSASEV